jgi:hypothetical protein
MENTAVTIEAAACLMLGTSALQIRPTRLAFVFNSDFGITEKAGRVFRPRIAGELERSDAGVAVTDVEVGTARAAAFHRPRALPQPGQDGIGVIPPNLRERPVPNIAQSVMPPKRIRMNVAQVVNIRHADARSIAPPPHQRAPDTIDMLGESFVYPKPQINAVGIIVTSDKLAIFTLLDRVPSG